MGYQNCPRNKYCSFKIVLSAPDCQIEACRYCHREVRYTIRKGEMDNERYRLDHIRDFCQPIGMTSRVFEEIYGSEQMKKIRSIAEEPMIRQRNQDKLSEEFRQYISTPEKTTFF